MKFFRPHPTLSGKIITVMVLANLAAIGILLPVLFHTLREGLRVQQQRHLVGVWHLVDRLLADNRQTIDNYARLFSNDRRIKDNLYYYAELAGERFHPENAIRDLAGTFHLQFLEVGDRHGKVAANVLTPERDDLDLSGDSMINEALAGKNAIGIEWYRDSFLLRGVAPIYHDEGQIIGTISAGMLMNNDFVRMIKRLSGVDLVIVDRSGRRVASSQENRWPLGKIHPSESRRRIAPQDSHLALELPFDDGRGAHLGTMIILAEDSVPALLATANRTIILVLAAVGLLSIFVTTLVLRRVLVPVGRLRRGAEKIGQGDFGHRIAVTSRDEIGSLAEVFNQMAANLEQLRQMEEKLHHSERLASIGEFTAAVAHELNNPIANIIGMAKVLRRETDGDSPLAEDLELIAKDAGRCGAIVRDLLCYSRSPAPRREMADLRTIIAEAVEGVAGHHLVGQRSRIVVPELPEPLPVFVEPPQIEQVFRNILRNALQAMPDGGEVRITAEKNADLVMIRFADSGCGIEEENLRRIFYPFFTTKKSGEGTGLGLAICHTIVQGHGGEIRVESGPGRGSTFTVVLPTGEDHG